jgi:hypothetical protein
MLTAIHDQITNLSMIFIRNGNSDREIAEKPDEKTSCTIKKCLPKIDFRETF